MGQIEQLQQQAFALHRDGQLAEAERLYLQILADRPHHATTLHALGTLEFQSSRGDAAIAHLEQAVTVDPDRAAFHYTLGEVYQRLGQRDQAKICFEQVVRLKPGSAEAHGILGNLLQAMGLFDEAIASFRTATRLQPGMTAAHFNLGNACRKAGRNSDAATSYREAIRLAPQFVHAHNNLGAVLRALGDNAAAASAFAEAVRLAPESAEAHHNFGMLKKREGKLAEARTLLARAIELDPQHTPSHFNLGGILFELKEWDQARRCYQQALQLRPNYAEPICSLGILCMAQGQLDEALGYFDRALAIQPDLAEAHCDRGMLLLVRGKLAAGWPEYQWRWQTPAARPRPPGPLWDGEPLAARTILLDTEQGYGDTFQFIRYAPRVKARGGRVIVSCPGRMVPILSTCPGIDEFHRVEEDPPPKFDVRLPLLDLPGIFRTELDSIPADVPYLSAEPQRVDHWRKHLGDSGCYRVGINWQGNPSYGWDQYRSIPLAEFARLADVEGVRLISLQKGFAADQLAAAPFAIEDFSSRLDEDAAFCDTAAVIQNLDLVITSDTSVAHLAGALGSRVWLALSFGPDWRWLLGREDCPWYPTMRLFRQTQLGHWGPVFERIANELRRLAEVSRADRPPRDA